MSTSRLKVGFIGAGGVTVQHLPALKRLGRTSLVGVVSRSLERASAVTSQWGGTPYTSTDRMLDEQRPDVAFICLPPYMTGRACQQLVDRRLPFLTEKPLSADAVTSDDIARAVRRRRLVTAVGYNWRGLNFLPAIRAAFAERPPHLLVARWLGDTPAAPWWRRVEQSGGQVVEQATHQFDLARFLLGEAEVISAQSARHERPEYPDADVDDVSVALLRFERGAIGSFASTCLTNSFLVEMEFVAEGRVATIRLHGPWPTFTWTATLDDGSAIRMLHPTRDPYEVQAEAFLDAVEANDPGLVLSSYEDALLTDRLTRAVVAEAGSRG